MKLKCYNQISKLNKVGDIMKLDIVGAGITAILGILIALANYLMSKQVLLKMPDKFALITVARQIIQVGFLVAVYFIGTKLTGISSVYLLAGAVAGMTVPMLFFTKKLLAVNNSSAGKEVSDNG